MLDAHTTIHRMNSLAYQDDEGTVDDLLKIFSWIVSAHKHKDTNNLMNVVELMSMTIFVSTLYLFLRVKQESR